MNRCGFLVFSALDNIDTAVCFTGDRWPSPSWDSSQNIFSMNCQLVRTNQRFILQGNYGYGLWLQRTQTWRKEWHDRTVAVVTCMHTRTHTRAHSCSVLQAAMCSCQNAASPSLQLFALLTSDQYHCHTQQIVLTISTDQNGNSGGCGFSSWGSFSIMGVLHQGGSGCRELLLT